MKFEVKNRFTGAVQFVAEIECGDDAPLSIKLGLAVKWALKNDASLDDARLDGASLDGARLVRASLNGASLDDARLDGASLDGARLDGASLVRASLVRASLNGASLDWASLDGARLVGARLVGASLVGASLEDARLDFAAWPLHCGSTNAKADDRLVSQLLYHATRLDVSECSGGVREAVALLREMAVCNLFPEYRDDTAKAEEFYRPDDLRFKPKGFEFIKEFIGT